MAPERNLKQILEKEGVVELEQDIRNLRRSEIKRFFGSSSSNRIIMSKFIKSVVWQAYTRIKSGQEPPIIGNIRTFWYRWLKPAMAKIPKKYKGKTDPYAQMLKVFSEFVLDLGLFRYGDFDFTDENWENRRIGDRKPEVLVFAEKRGWIRFLRRAHEKYGVSVLALGGFSSALTSEYTAKGIEAAKEKEKPIRLVGIVDFNPSGHLIAKSFRDQLESLGMTVERMDLIIEPKYYTQEEIELSRYPLPERQKTKTRRWMAKTGGINGEPYGLESESMPLERLEELLELAILEAP